MAVKSKSAKKISVKKVTPKTVKPGVKKTQSLPESKEKTVNVRVQLSVLDTDGKVEGKVSVPAKLFAAKINPKLMAQAVRVYLANQRESSASTKTRSEVEGSTRKIYRQKGTGRARHGAIRAPIFVGGGVAFGPRPHDFNLGFTKKMKRAALASAITTKNNENNIIVVNGLNSLEKTKLMARCLVSIDAGNKPLLVVAKDSKMAIRSVGNIEGVEVLQAGSLTAYTILQHPKMVFMKEALPVLADTFAK